MIEGSALTSWDEESVAELAEVSRTLRARLDPSPVGETEFYADAFAPLLGTWQALSLQEHPQAHMVAHIVDRPLPYGLDVALLATLETRWFEALAAGATALQHGDLRRDNVIRDFSGRLWIVDWTHRWTAPGWVDMVRVAPDIAASGDDPEQFFRSTALERRTAG